MFCEMLGSRIRGFRLLRQSGWDWRDNVDGRGARIRWDAAPLLRDGASIAGVGVLIALPCLVESGQPRTGGRCVRPGSLTAKVDPATSWPPLVHQSSRRFQFVNKLRPKFVHEFV